MPAMFSPQHYGMAPHSLYALSSPYQHVGSGFAPAATLYGTPAPAAMCFPNGFQGKTAASAADLL